MSLESKLISLPNELLMKIGSHLVNDPKDLVSFGIACQKTNLIVKTRPLSQLIALCQNQHILQKRVRELEGDTNSKGLINCAYQKVLKAAVQQRLISQGIIEPKADALRPLMLMNVIDGPTEDKTQEWQEIKAFKNFEFVNDHFNFLKKESDQLHQKINATDKEIQKLTREIKKNR